jgi:hypothetical protein
VDRDQVFLFPLDMREWLPADHPVWLVISVVERHCTAPGSVETRFSLLAELVVV